MSDQISQPKTRQEFESELVIKAWQDEDFKQELINNPKIVYERELGKQAPEGFQITIVQEQPNHIYLVLPVKPDLESSQELSEEALEAVAGGDHMLSMTGVVGLLAGIRFNW